MHTKSISISVLYVINDLFGRKYIFLSHSQGIADPAMRYEVLCDF